jgi:hypothetical protein
MSMTLDPLFDGAECACDACKIIRCRKSVYLFASKRRRVSLSVTVWPDPRDPQTGRVPDLGAR